MMNNNKQGTKYAALVLVLAVLAAGAAGEPQAEQLAAAQCERHRPTFLVQQATVFFQTF